LEAIWSLTASVISLSPYRSRVKAVAGGVQDQDGSIHVAKNPAMTA
jgi:hypothetical protein